MSDYVVRHIKEQPQHQLKCKTEIVMIHIERNLLVEPYYFIPISSVVPSLQQIHTSRFQFLSGSRKLCVDQFLQSLLNDLPSFICCPNFRWCFAHNIPADKVVGQMAQISLFFPPLSVSFHFDARADKYQGSFLLLNIPGAADFIFGERVSDQRFLELCLYELSILVC